jgi:hydrogenase expression/formation protein HypC
VIAVDGPTRVQIELANGDPATVDCSLTPGVSIGDFVLVDRGLVVEVISAEDAQAILRIYAEMGELLAAEDALA